MPGETRSQVVSTMLAHVWAVQGMIWGDQSSENVKMILSHNSPQATRFQLQTLAAKHFILVPRMEKRATKLFWEDKCMQL